MIKLKPFQPSDFDDLIRWIDNEELLITIAGYDLTYPLDTSQLQAYLDDANSYSFRIEDSGTGRSVGHAEIRVMGNGLYKLDKVLIGEPGMRGKGTGLQVINELLAYSFENLGAAIVELNVFDWNTAGIRCYEKAGFTFNPDKHHTVSVKDKEWRVLNMIISQENWKEKIRLG